ncbi:MAG: branched-chain amino acid ABC transporter substrate-binding protein [Desulfobacteraceae bacterium]|nr:MAG: branched-chain amino acid ABC transporter substrate-binding protein [Desulfobacteraceae bacterium]
MKLDREWCRHAIVEHDRPLLFVNFAHLGRKAAVRDGSGSYEFSNNAKCFGQKVSFAGKKRGFTKLFGRISYYLPQKRTGGVMRRFVIGFVLFSVLLFAIIFTLTNSPSEVVASGKSNADSLTEACIKEGKINDSFDIAKMGDMSDYDPSNPVIPKGDTIKIGLVMPFSGPAASIGDTWFLLWQWVAHDYNQRGGIRVNGKLKKVEIVKADNRSNLDQTRSACERMMLQEKVDFLAGSESTPNTKVLQEIAGRYKKIAVNCAAHTDELMDSKHFNRYTFMTVYSSNQVGESLAYYYGQIRKKEKKFYILCQDYSWGRAVADSFKQGLKKFHPEAEIVGEDYHALFLTDFAPYMSKIKASGAEVIVTGDWRPDVFNLIKQARQFNIQIPIAGRDLENPVLLSELGLEQGKNLVSMTSYNASNPVFQSEQQKNFHKIWTNLSRNKWKSQPYNNNMFEYPEQILGRVLNQVYWFFSVLERAGTTDPEKIISLWENDRYMTLNGKVLLMRACDHRVVQDVAAVEIVPPEEQKTAYNIPPYRWFDDICFAGPAHIIPAGMVPPWMDQKLDRCAGKNYLGD